MGTIGDWGWVLGPFEEEKQRSPSARPGQARPHPDASPRAASAIRRALSENRGKPVGG